ncbi:MAG: glycoside hydrolase [Hyperionvirus sp.]|uniref:Glycoside hydrolase n=1 Tax=Hyperionvirus sp. TaxID=2487770 RepID=A0A3G5ABW9_9VIRU|nr:MAG: glycoside hydrolase [Hyperionvirus sp.]
MKEKEIIKEVKKIDRLYENILSKGHEKRHRKKTHKYDCPEPFDRRTITTILPKKVICIDEKLNWGNPPSSILKAIDDGYNVINLGFYLDAGRGPSNMALIWKNFTKELRDALLAYAHSKKAVIMVSVGGPTSTTIYTSNPEAFATEVTIFANEYNLDGIDYMLNRIETGFMYGSIKVIDWTKLLNNKSREILGSNKLLTHTPEALYFGQIGSTTSWAGTSGGYTSVYDNNKTIDWFNIQFYNKASSAYNIYTTLFNESDGYALGTSLTEIASYGIPLEKLIVGKPLSPSNTANNGYITPNNLRNYFIQAQNNLGWNAGVMFFQWNETHEPKIALDTIYPPILKN